MTPWLSRGRSLVFGFLLAGLVLGEEHSLSWDARFTDSITALKAGNFDQAAGLLESMSQEAKTFAPGDKRRAESILALAVAYHSGGHLNQAEPLYLEAKLLLESRRPTSDSTYALALDHLGQLRLEQGRWQDAVQLLEKARELYLKTRHPGDPRIANITRLLGEAYLAESRVDDARPLLQQAVDLLRQRSDIPGDSLAAALRALATLYTVQGQYDLAEPLLEEALQLNRGPGSSRPELADSMLALGHLYLLQGDTARAEPLLRKSVGIFDVTADSHLPAGLSALGAAALQEGKFALAKEYLARALEISRQRSEGDHLTISLAQAGLAEAYLGERNYPQAAALIRQAISTERASREESHYPMAKLLLTAANIETYQHRWPQAEAYYREALEIYRKVLRPDHPDLMKAKRQYAQFSKSFRK